MTNTFKKSLLFALACLTTGTIWGQTTKTYTFDDSVPLETDWTVTKDVPTGGNGSCEIASPSKFSAKNGNYLLFSFENKSNISITITSTASYSNISNITFDAVANDNSKPDFTLNIVDDNGDVVKNIYSKYTTKTNFNTGGTNKWGVSNSDINPNVSGHMQLVLYASSSGKYAAIDNVQITHSSTPAEPVAVTGVTLDKTTLSISQNKTAQLTATVQPANADNKKVSWTSNNPAVATVDSIGKVTAVAEGTATITVTTEDGNHTATCVVTVTPPAAPVPATGITLAPTTLTVKVGATGILLATVAPAEADDKTVTWTSSNNAIATVTPQASATGIVTGVAEGTATITASTVNGFTATCTVTVTTATPVPQTDLTLHEPEIYEGKSMAGGYDGELIMFNNREYEVYYMTRDADSKFCIATTNADKTTGITTRGSNDYACTATDGWFKFSGTGWSSSSDVMGDEFGTMARRLDMDNSCEFTMHIKGFDQFALVARDKKKDTSSGQTKPGDNKYLEVYIDDVLQPLQFDANPSIRRYDVSVAEHVVRVKHFGGDKSAMYAFSLRVSDNPRTKYLKGNDTTQVILQTQAPLPVYYTTKNFSKGMPEILWEGNAAEGISLTSKAHDNLRDTSFITGVANCPIGEYKYYVITKANGVETSRSKQGKFSVIRKVEFQNKRDSAVTIYQETALTPIVINYYSTDDDALTWEWVGSQNLDITFAQDKNANTLTISGTPQSDGTFQYTVHLTDAEDIHGQITVRSNQPTIVPGADKTMLYLSKTDDLPSNGIFNELKGKYNYFPRAAAAGIGNTQTYNGYDFILISENVDADNEEALALIRGEIDKPVLNMKAFTYAPERVSKEGWGEPDNGTLNENDGLYITVQRDDHPIFKALNKKQGDKIKVLSQIDQKGLMPININHCNGSLALATAYPRDINDYYESAEYQQTILHEIPAGSSLRKGNSKYICMPIAMSSSNYITNDAKQLLAQVIDYLTSSETSTVSVPELKITSFSIDGVAAQIGNDTILLEMDTTAHSVDLSKAIPAITVASQYTHTEPMAGEEVNFMNSAWVPVVYTVTDFINRRTYDVIVRAYNPQGIDEVYTAGEWVNIYDVFGRMITTTNQDIYTTDLPRGMYIVVTAKGGTLKIMK